MARASWGGLRHPFCFLLLLVGCLHLLGCPPELLVGWLTLLLFWRQRQEPGHSKRDN